MSIIDLSRLPLPSVIEELDYDILFDAFVRRFLEVYEAERAIDSTLPVYDVAGLQHDPAMIVGQAWSYLRLLDRTRVNDAISALLAPRATGSNLDNVVARQNIERLTIRQPTANTPAVKETDAQLLRRYLLAFERPSAGSANRYLYEAWTAWPEMHDARVNGHAVHRRRGETDIVIVGPSGRLPSDEEIRLVRTAVTAPNVQPEAVAVNVVPARQANYQTSLILEVPVGPDPQLVRAEALTRVAKAAQSRMIIGGEVPAGFLAGAAYGDSIITVRDLAPVLIDAHPEIIPVQTEVSIEIRVRS